MSLWLFGKEVCVPPSLTVSVPLVTGKREKYEDKRTMRKFVVDWHEAGSHCDTYRCCKFGC